MSDAAETIRSHDEKTERIRIALQNARQELSSEMSTYKAKANMAERSRDRSTFEARAFEAKSLRAKLTEIANRAVAGKVNGPAQVADEIVDVCQKACRPDVLAIVLFDLA